jgi:hypothetical protein
MVVRAITDSYGAGSRALPVVPARNVSPKGDRRRDGETLTRRMNMHVAHYKRTRGQHLIYTIRYDDGEYLIERDGRLKKSVPDVISLGMDPHEAKAALMLRTAISDIEALIGMDE